MNGLAEHLLELADSQAMTPVVIARPDIRLRASFYAALAESLQATGRRELTLEWIADLEGWTSGIQGWMLRGLAARVNAITPPEVQTAMAAVVARPAGQQRPLVVSFARQGIVLPPWAQPTYLSTRPTATTDFQLVAV